MSTLRYLMALVAMIVTTVRNAVVATIPAIVKAEDCAPSKGTVYIHPVLGFIIPAVMGATLRLEKREISLLNRSKKVRSLGTLTQKGNVRALAHRTAVNMARRNKAAKVALQYGHRAIQAQRSHAKMVREILASGKSLNCGIKAKKRAQMGTGFLAKDVKKNTYRSIAVGCKGTFTVKAVRVAYVRSLPTKDQIRAGKAAARLQSFHAWVIAQDGGWISKSGKVRLAALQQKVAA